VDGGNGATCLEGPENQVLEDPGITGGEGCSRRLIAREPPRGSAHSPKVRRPLGRQSTRPAALRDSISTTKARASARVVKFLRPLLPVRASMSARLGNRIRPPLGVTSGYGQWVVSDRCGRPSRPTGE